MSAEYRAFMIRGDDGEEYGPVDLGELREWVQENRAGLGTAVRLDEPGASWQTWQTYPELVALLAEVNVTTPLPGQPGLVAAPLGRRVLALALDLILGSFLASPILSVILMAYMPDWNDQFSRAILDPQTPVAHRFFHYALIGNMIFYSILAVYMAGFHALHGRTPGKSMLHLQVVDQNGRKPSWIKCILRAVVFVLSLYCYGLPFCYVFFNPQRRALHDLVANTYVVER